MSRAHRVRFVARKVDRSALSRVIAALPKDKPKPKAAP